MEKFQNRGKSGVGVAQAAVALVGRRRGRLVVALAVVFSVLAIAFGGTATMENDTIATLPKGVESTEVAELEARLPSSKVAPAIVVFSREDGRLSAADRAAATDASREVARFAVGEKVAPPVLSDSGRAVLVAVPLSTGLSAEDLDATIGSIRGTVGADLPEGLAAQVTGGPAFEVDLSAVFDGADLRLLVATVLVVALLLLLTYRSPWLWLVPLAVVGTADQVAAKAVAVLDRYAGLTVDGATTGITAVLVFGAGTNYALLLIARYREELRQVDDRHEAMRAAVGSAAPAILASSSTVILALLTLGFTITPFSRSIGYAGAAGIAVAVAYALLVLPAAMTLFGRGLFWPFTPRVGQPEPTRTAAWFRVGRAVVRRPVLVAGSSILLLAVLAGGVTGLRAGLSETEQFRSTPEAVSGQQALAANFPGGAAQPATIIANAAEVDAVVAAARTVDGVQSVTAGASADSLAQVDAVLEARPGTAASFSAVERLRTAVHAVPGADAKVGGTEAKDIDARDAAARDRLVVIPMILGIVLVVLLLLLRSVVAAVVLVLTVVATYAASMGAGWFAFDHWFGFPAMDLAVPLLAFLFLVALGVDYNIFLTTRAREQTEDASARDGIVTALAVTGGVITSAGILLAAVFTVLGVLPLITLTQIGVIVGFGVLLDTLLVRSVLVPALVALLGRWFWWPGHLSRADR